MANETSAKAIDSATDATIGINTTAIMMPMPDGGRWLSQEELFYKDQFHLL
jgi:hypothetical protein